VDAPAIQWNTPAVDTSGVRFEVRQGSVFRDEAAALEGLRSGLTELSKLRAAEHVHIVRDTGRRQTERFVETWLGQAFSDGGKHRAVVRFADEAPSAPAEPLSRP
jgi:hypothetical protein